MSRRTPHGTTPATAKNILEAQVILWLICGNCDREAKPDLPAIIRRGLGDRAVTDLRFRCSECGSRAVHPRLSSVTADRGREDRR
jgi:DNA-directed RNA polymerase subunit RPC12/RpoP